MKRTTRRALLAVMTLALVLALSPAPAGAANTGVDLNCAPVAENLELTTYRGVTVSGRFRSLDPEGDAVTYCVVRQPKKGEITVDGESFTYTPGEGKKGKDTFTYAAVDIYGNVSNEAAVTVNIKKQKTAVTYSDMAGDPQGYAAAVLAERGIFVGECLGGEYIFNPDAEVTRGEFLVMCMRAAGAELLEGVTRTGFFDDEAIPMWQKPYVTTALTEDMISGSVNGEGRTVFSPGDPITFAQATVMLNNAVGITDVWSAGDLPEAAPAWAWQASVNLTSCDIIRDSQTGVSSSTVTRADAAEMLLGAMEVMDSRTGGSLLDWLK